MKSRTVLGFLVWLCHSGFFPADGELLYQLVIFADNPPAGALDKISKNSLFLTQMWLNLIPGYSVVGPGQSESCKRRLGEEETDGTAPALRGGSGGSSSSAASRDLAILTLCPPQCKNGNSKYCKSLSCCGSCDDRRQRDLNSYGWDMKCNQISVVEWAINSQLYLYCNFQRDCSIKAKVMELSINGNTTTSKPACP